MIRIDELHVKAPGRNPEDGNALGRQLSERLAETLHEPSGNVHIPEIRVRLQIASLDDTRQAADQIAEQIITKIKMESFRL
jgi:hypothetical protein